MSSNEAAPAAPPAPERRPPLTMRRKVAYVCTFFAGMFFSSPPFMPVSIACAAILLLQTRNKKTAFLGLVLAGLQVVVVAVFLELMLNAGRGVP